MTIGRVLIANRGEIARRVIRTCRRLGIATVAIHSDADRDAPYVREADDAIHLPGTAASATYLDAALIVDAARRSGADAVHPGYGFLSERADFARAVEAAGLTWIGPPASAIESMGSKIGAKAMMRAAGVPVAPDSSVDGLDAVGLPALVKASAGGGGRGMRIVRTAGEMADAIAGAEREAAAAFGDGTVFVERYVEGGRHVEIQVFADAHGNTVSLFERDCTLQRRHQKILEESPSPAVDDDLRHRMSDAAVAAARAVGYVGAGTVEFLLDRDGSFFFLEMNTRLQVEHPVTEMITGLDLVELQLIVAAGQRLPSAALSPSRNGHAIEVRLCAEDPAAGYLPSAGTFAAFSIPDVTGVRVDSGVESGSVVSPYYDSMIAKVIAHGPSRAEAARRLATALRGADIVGPTTNRAQLIDLVDRLTSIDDEVDTAWLDRNPPGVVEVPVAARVAAALAVASGRVGRRTVLPHVPSGWRNNPALPQQQAVSEHPVAYRHDRFGRLEWVSVDGADLTDAERTEAGALSVHLAGDRAHVAGGLHSLILDPRFSPPDAAGLAGSLVAPMPGSVVRIDVEVGERVVAGQPLLVLEAMKMEHQVVSPADGIVLEIFVAERQQLDAGQPLLRVGDHDDATSTAAGTDPAGGTP